MTTGPKVQRYYVGAIDMDDSGPETHAEPDANGEWAKWADVERMEADHAAALAAAEAKLTACVEAMESAQASVSMLLPYLSGDWKNNMGQVVAGLRTALAAAKGQP